MYDELTQLATRKKFLLALSNQLEGESANTNTACLIITIHDLKRINSAMGFDCGDRMLTTFAARLESILKPTDMAARIGGSKFGLMLTSIMNTGHATLAAHKILKFMQEPFTIDSQQVKLKLSMGIALYPEHAQDANRLMLHSEAALEQTRSSRHHFSLYSKDLDSYHQYNLLIEAELEKAIHTDQLMMHYQPQINLQNQQIHGVESLVRWHHPVHGFIPPDRFVKMAEDCGLIVPLTLWTINTTLRHCKQVPQIQHDFKVSINLSAALLGEDDLVELIMQALDMWGTKPQNLVLEVTESAMMTDPEKSFSALNNLHDNGINLSIDDFGTGHSSLAYLKQLPVSELKIDKSFVINMNNNEDDGKIVRTIIDLAHNFDLKVVAEGIEDQASQDALKEMQCNIGQGYYIARPMPNEEARTWIMGKLVKSKAS